MSRDRLAAALSDRYRIERELGAGGMATVYLAEDLKHHRKVAIKVLRQDIAASLGAARFLREIEIAAQLQHPHILPLLDSGNTDGFLYYVMPYVEGESLRERLKREGELPVDEAVRLLVEIVDALACAHDRGVVHRDIKPDNIMLSGRHALVADFGVAKALQESQRAEGGDRPGHQTTLTSRGVALGTPAYMSPEQAVADSSIDRRTDIYSVGALAYELVCGRPPFIGGTPQQILAAQVAQTPDPASKYRPGLPTALDALIAACLAKRPADRFQQASDLRAALEAVLTRAAPSDEFESRQPLGRSIRWRKRTPLALGFALAGLALGVLAARNGNTASIKTGRIINLTTDDGVEIQPAISPSGKSIAYAAGTSVHGKVYVRSLGGSAAIPVANTRDTSQQLPRWSPSETSLLFLVPDGIDTVAAPSGIPVRLVTGPNIQTATWSPDGKSIAYARHDSLWEYTVRTGNSRLIRSGTAVHSCEWSPRADRIACVRGIPGFAKFGTDLGDLGPSRLVLISVNDGSLTTVSDSNTFNQSPVWSPDGAGLYFVSNRDGRRDVYYQRVSSSGRARGEPARVTTAANVATISLSRDGRYLAFSAFTAITNVWSIPVGPVGKPSSMADATQVTFGHQVIESMRVSTDWNSLVYDSDRNGNQDIWRVTVNGGEPEQLTTDPRDEIQADLSPRVVTYTLHGEGLVAKSLDGGRVRPVTKGGRAAQSRNGTMLAFNSDTGLYVIRRMSGDSWGPPVLRASKVFTPRWSPDDLELLAATIGAKDSPAKIVVTRVDSGPVRIVHQFPETTRLAEGASWSRSGAEILFRENLPNGTAKFWSMPASGGEPVLRGSISDTTRPSYRSYFATDGLRFFFLVSDRRSDISVLELIVQ